jgi:sugar phosphate isomerase/epimerase
MPPASRDPLDRLTIGHYMMRRWSLEDDVRGLERLGFRSISLASTKLDAYGPRRAIDLLKRSALRVAHVGSYGRFGTSRASRRAGMDQVRRALEWTHELGGDVLVVIPGGRDGATWERAADVYADAYTALLPDAARAGVRSRSRSSTRSARTCRS